MKTLTRRRLLAAGLGAGALAVLAACSAPAASPTASSGTTSAPTTTTSTGTTGATPQAGAQRVDKIVFGFDNASVKVPDGGQNTNSQTSQYLRATFDTLTMIDRDGKLKPSIAKSWQMVDSTTWEFTIRDDLKFHDGSPLEAADVAGTFKRYMDPETRSASITMFTGVDSIEAPNQTTVRFRLKAPDPTFAKLMSQAMVMPARLIERIGFEEFLKNPVGTGPYRWTVIDPNNLYRWEAMPPDFVSPSGSAPTQVLEMRFIGDASTKVAALKTGEIDIATPVSHGSLDDLRASGFTVVPSRGTSVFQYQINTYIGPTQDYRVRQAINYAVDKATLVKQLQSGIGEPMGQLLGPSCLGHDPSLQPYAYDPDRARQLLAEAGYPNGFELPIMSIATSSFPKDITESVAAYLGQVGIQAQIQILETAVWLETVRSAPDKRPGLLYCPFNWDPTFEANSVFRWYSKTDTPSERLIWDDPRFDELYQTAKQETDETKRGELYRAANRYFHEQVPALILWTQDVPVAMAANVTWTPGGFPDMYTGALSKKA